jgi:hypothetical protein
MTGVSVADDAPLCAAIWAAIRWHETRDQAAAIYALSWAEDGQSGGSYGALQHDCHATAEARSVLADILGHDGVPAAEVSFIVASASLVQHSRPLSPARQAAADAALRSEYGRGRVDALDQVVFNRMLPELDACVAAAARNGSTIAPEALIGMAIWINAAGPPTDLLRWLEGDAVPLAAGTPPRLVPGQTVELAGAAGLDAYLIRTLEISRRPALLKDLADAVQVGMAAYAPPPRD